MVGHHGAPEGFLLWINTDAEREHDEIEPPLIDQRLKTLSV
jgi:hypothetical protein